MKKIFITGITGQDGLFLVSKILENDKSTEIYGSTRNINNTLFFKKLKSISNIPVENIRLLNIDLQDYSAVNKFLNDVKPTQIYNLSGPSSVSESTVDNGLSKSSIITIFDNLINSLMHNNLFPDFYQASSSEMFEVNSSGIFNEKSKLQALTPYAEAKIINHCKVKDLRKDFDWNITSGLMFNHESEFRDKDYLLMQIITAAMAISERKIEELKVGDVDLVRDWSFAGDVADAIYKINNESKSDSYVIGTGVGTSVKELVDVVFTYFKLNFEDFLTIDKNLTRENNQKKIVADNRKIKSELGWLPSLDFEQIVHRCIQRRFNIIL